MKEERKIKSPNEIIKFKIENTHFVYSTFYDKNSFFTFVHKTNEDSVITKDSPLLMQFESKTQAEYLSLKRSFGALLNNFSVDIKHKNKIENQLVETFKEHMVIDNKWYNPSYTYVAPAPAYNNSNNSVSGNNNQELTGYQECSKIKPVILLETLQALGEIVVDNITYNTTGEEFWHYRIASDSSKSFKTSVKNKSFLFESDENLYKSAHEIFNDVKISSKGYGKGSIGLIRFLGDNGLFTNSLKENDEESKIRAINYLLTKVMPHVDPAFLADNMDMANKFKGADGVKINNYPRLPFKNNAKINVIKDHLVDVRRLSNKLVTRLIDEGLLYAGNFASSKMDITTELRYFRDQYFFNLTNVDGVVTGAERLYISPVKDYVTGNSVLKLQKQNTHPVKGNGFRLMAKNNNPVGTFIAEAVIDVCSAYELFAIAGIDPENFNYISIQGCPNLNTFFNHNAGFGFDLDEKYRPNGEFFGVKYKIEKEKISSAKIENYNNNLRKNDYYFVNTGNEKCQEILNKIPYANKVVGKEIKIINKKSRDDYIDYNSYDKKTAIFLDETSFDEFFNINRVSFDFDQETKKYKTMLITEKEECIKLNPEVKTRITNIMMKNFGTTTLMIGLDFDEAGLKFRKRLSQATEFLGIKVFDMYPDVLKVDPKNQADPKIDVNDILKTYYKLKDAGKEEEALTIVENYVKKIVPNLNILKKNRATNKP